MPDTGANPALQDPRVRQAIAHAIDRETIVNSLLPEGAEQATQFMPPTVDGWADDVTTYDYDPERAKALLAEAGATGHRRCGSSTRPTSAGPTCRTRPRCSRSSART